MTMSTSAANRGSIDPPCRLARRHGLVLSGLALSVAVLLAGCNGGGSDRDVPTPTPTPRATDPLAIDTPPPTYPMELACAGLGGEVVLALSLDAQGFPADVRIENSSRRPALDVAAVAAIRTWRFQPATNRGQPVPTRIRVPVKFTPPVMRPDRCFGFDEEQRRAR